MGEGYTVSDHIKVRAAALLLAVLCLSVLGGCASQRHYKQVEKRAQKYYAEKYGVKGVTVEDSYKAGNSGLFGYIGVNDRAYVMSDGSTVYWDDDAETFSDDAQSDEIMEDFRTQMLEPLLSEISLPMKVAGSVGLNRTGFDSFDECVFTGLYTGDIRAFLKEEQPELSGITLAVETEDRDRGEREITGFFNSLEGYVTGWTYAYILSEDLASLTGEDWWVDDHALNVTATARCVFKEGIHWYRQAYVEVYEDVYVTSTEWDFALEEGDIVFEEVGTCAELQKMLDDGYYSLPVDAEENKNGGYMVHDQRHERRVLLDDRKLPYFRAKMSPRVMDALDDTGCISVYVLDLREDGPPLMVYYGRESNSPYSVYTVCPNRAGRGEYEKINPAYYYYFGTSHYEE